MNLKTFLFAMLILSFVTGCKRNDSSLNADFERIDTRTKIPEGWTTGYANSYRCFADSMNVKSGRYSLRIESAGLQSGQSQDFGIIKTLENVKPEKSIRITAYIKTQDVSNDSLGLIIGTYRYEQDTMIVLKDKNLIGTNDWKEYSLEVPAKNQKDSYFIGATFRGKGKIWLDDYKVYVDGVQLLNLPEGAGFSAGKKELEWLKNNCVPLKTVQAGSGFEDLQPLKQLIGNARIVALGENTHGSREVFQMKHRLVEFLAKEMGFTIFSIEASMPEAYRINDYVHKNTHFQDPKSLLKGMYFWTWNTQEVLDMVEWMKQYNGSGSGNIQFTGFDMQFIKGSLENLQSLSKYDHVLKSKIDSLAARFSRDYYDFTRTANSAEIDAVRKKCRNIRSYITDNQGPVSAAIGEKDYNWLLQNANILIQCVEMPSNSSGFMYRDKSMAENVEWILNNNPDAKIILWAHNGHVMRYRNSMGKFLSAKYGPDYYSIGFTSNSGSYTAVGYQRLSSDNQLKESKPGSYEYSFHRTRIPIFYLDFSRLNESVPESRWLNEELNFRRIGAAAQEDQFSRSILPKEFNAVIYIDKQTASKCFDVKPELKNSK